VLITIDQSSGLLAQWWARRCFRYSEIPPDELGEALNAAHAEILDDIRADRPVEATERMQALCELHQVIWDAYAAYGKTYDLDAVQGFHLFRLTAGERIVQLLADELRAAAVSKDTRIRWEASMLPRRLARDALPARAAATVSQILQTLSIVYDAVVNELTDDGHQVLPPGGAARDRLQAPFHSLLSFTTSDLQRAIEQPAFLRQRAPEGSVADTQTAVFAAMQLSAAYRQLLEMLKHAARLRDSPTVRAVLDAAQMPDVSLTRNALNEAAERTQRAAQQGGEHRADVPVALQHLAAAQDVARDNRNALPFRLLITALRFDRATTRTQPSPYQAGITDDHDLPPESRNKHYGEPDPVVTAALGHLPAGQLWHILDTALAAANSEVSWPPADGQILPDGVYIGGATDLLSPTLEAFALAAILRPELAAGSQPSRDLALTGTQMLSTAVDRVLSSQLPWLERYGVGEDTARQRGVILKDQLTAAAGQAHRDRDQEIRDSPISDTAVDKLRTETRIAFHAADITTRLLTWAGNPPSTAAQHEGGACLLVPIEAPRRMFIRDDDSDITDLASQAGQSMAYVLLKYMLGFASEHSETSTISPSDAALKVRYAIGEVRGPADAKVAVFIPQIPLRLRTDIGVTAERTDDKPADRRSRKHDTKLRALGLRGTDLVNMLAGTIDGAPVLKTRIPGQRIVVINLAYLKATLYPAETGHPGPGPDLTLVSPRRVPQAPGTEESQPAQQQDSATSSDPNPANGTPPGFEDETMQVRLRLSLPLQFAATGQPLARIFTWNEEWPG
jgi:hypothetical protein